jgi:NhaP-type Na+/H+ or K+/H+ antiporter
MPEVPVIFVPAAAGVAAFGGIAIGYLVGRFDRWLDRHPEDDLARRDRQVYR